MLRSQKNIISAYLKLKYWFKHKRREEAAKGINFSFNMRNNFLCLIFIPNSFAL